MDHISAFAIQPHLTFKSPPGIGGMAFRLLLPGSVCWWIQEKNNDGPLRDLCFSEATGHHKDHLGIPSVNTSQVANTVWGLETPL